MRPPTNVLGSRPEHPPPQMAHPRHLRETASFKRLDPAVWLSVPIVVVLTFRIAPAAALGSLFVSGTYGVRGSRGSARGDHEDASGGAEGPALGRRAGRKRAHRRGVARGHRLGLRLRAAGTRGFRRFDDRVQPRRPDREPCPLRRLVLHADGLDAPRRRDRLRCDLALPLGNDPWSCRRPRVVHGTRPDRLPGPRRALRRGGRGLRGAERRDPERSHCELQPASDSTADLLVTAEHGARVTPRRGAAGALGRAQHRARARAGHRRGRVSRSRQRAHRPRRRGGERRTAATADGGVPSRASRRCVAPNCCRACIASRPWWSAGCWAPTKAASSPGTCRHTWTSSPSASTAGDPARAACSSTACSSSPSKHRRAPTARSSSIPGPASAALHPHRPTSGYDPPASPESRSIPRGVTSQPEKPMNPDLLHSDGNPFSLVGSPSRCSRRRWSQYNGPTRGRI